MKVLFLIGSLAFVSLAFGDQPLLDRLKTEYNLVEGQYKLRKGQPENCIEGDYQLLEGGDGVVSIQVDGGLLAQNIHNPVVTMNENGCSYNYTNTAHNGGLKNIEAVNCAESKISYSRTLIIKFSDNGLTYKLSSVRPIEEKKSELTCRLDKIKD